MEAQQFSPTTPQTDFAVLEDNTLLIVDDDRAFLARLARAMETRGFAGRGRGLGGGWSVLAQAPPAGFRRGGYAAR